MSSVYSSGYVASKCIDGVTTSGMCHTSVGTGTGEKNPWLQIDLGATQTVAQVTIYNRQDCSFCLDRLAHHQIWLSDSSTTPATKCFDGTAGNSAGPFKEECIATGRYVRIVLPGNSRILNLAEVKVFRYDENFMHVCGVSQGFSHGVDEGEAKGCSGTVNYAAATQFCAVGHGRLPTKYELTMTVAQGTGCGYDTERIWTSTPCEYNGISAEAYWTNFGMLSYGVWECTPASTPLKARCASEARLPSGPTPPPPPSPPPTDCTALRTYSGNPLTDIDAGVNCYKVSVTDAYMWLTKRLDWNSESVMNPHFAG
jgi:hypothetical protein